MRLVNKYIQVINEIPLKAFSSVQNRNIKSRMSVLKVIDEKKNMRSNKLKFIALALKVMKNKGKCNK